MEMHCVATAALQERNPIQQRPVVGAVVTKLFRLVWLKKTQQAS